MLLGTVAIVLALLAPALLVDEGTGSRAPWATIGNLPGIGVTDDVVGVGESTHP